MPQIKTSITAGSFRAYARRMVDDTRANLSRYILAPIRNTLLTTVCCVAAYEGARKAAEKFSKTLPNDPEAIVFTSLAIGIGIATFHAIKTLRKKGYGKSFADESGERRYTRKEINRKLLEELKTCGNEPGSKKILNTIQFMQRHGRVDVFADLSKEAVRLLTDKEHIKDQQRDSSPLLALATASTQAPVILSEVSAQHLQTHLKNELESTETGLDIFDQIVAHKNKTRTYTSFFEIALETFDKTRPDLIDGLSNETGLACARKLVTSIYNVGDFKNNTSYEQFIRIASGLSVTQSLFMKRHNLQEASNYLGEAVQIFAQNQLKRMLHEHKIAVRIAVKTAPNRQNAIKDSYSIKNGKSAIKRLYRWMNTSKPAHQASPN